MTEEVQNPQAEAPVETNIPAPAENANANQPSSDAQPQAPQPDASAEGENKQPEGEKKKSPWWESRIREMAWEKNEAKRQKDALEAENKALKAAMEAAKRGSAENPDGQAPTAPQAAITQADIDRLAEEKASQKLAAQQAQARIQDFQRKGTTNFQDWNDRCNVVASLGATDRPEFLEIVTGMEDGHKLVAHLAENPEEAIRVLQLNPFAMASELTRMSIQMSTPAPKQISNAPAPIKPLTPQASPQFDPEGENVSMEEWIAWRKKQKQGKAA